MGWLSNNQSKSMLGQLLVKQKLITEEQLANAIELQRTTGQRLGDVFAELNLITQQHIEEALRKQRRLAEEGTSFTNLVDDTRRELARQSLCCGELSLKMLSFQLGFSEPSAFYRACKRWFGMAPSDIVHMAHQPGPEPESMNATTPRKSA